MKTASVRKPNLMAKPVNSFLKAPAEVATLPPEEEYDQRDDVLLELAEANEALTDRLSIQTMDATDEEKALAAETIANLREENRILTNQCNSLTHSRNTYQHKAAEAIKQCDIYRNVIKKLNKQVEQLQAKLNSHPPQEEPVPF
jgi:chromosome segregation ATPase